MRRLTFVFALALCLVALPALAQNLVPPSKGFWGIQDNKLVQMLRPEVQIKNYQDKDVKGFPTNTQFKEFDTKPRFVLWDDFVDPNKGQAVELVFEGKRMVDGTEMKTDRWELDMYVRTGDAIPVTTAEVPGQQNMTQVYFNKPLKPGYYVIYFGDSMSQVIDDKYKNNLFVFEVK